MATVKGQLDSHYAVKHADFVGWLAPGLVCSQLSTTNHRQGHGTECFPSTVGSRNWSRLCVVGYARG